MHERGGCCCCGGGGGGAAAACAADRWTGHVCAPRPLSNFPPLASRSLPLDFLAAQVAMLLGRTEMWTSTNGEDVTVRYHVLHTKEQAPITCEETIPVDISLAAKGTEADGKDGAHAAAVHIHCGRWRGGSQLRVQTRWPRVCAGARPTVVVFSCGAGPLPPTMLPLKPVDPELSAEHVASVTYWVRLLLTKSPAAPGGKPSQQLV